MHVSISTNGSFPFDFLDVVLEADYFRVGPGQQRFLQMARDLYALVNPAYGMLEYSVTRHSKTGKATANAARVVKKALLRTVVSML